MYYNAKFREKVLEQVNCGESIRNVARLFKISPDSIVKWKRLKKEQGNLDNRPLNRRYRKVNPEAVRRYYEEHPSAYIREVATYFQVSYKCIWHILNKVLHYVRKKNKRPIEKEMKNNGKPLNKLSKLEAAKRSYTWTKPA